MARWLGHSCVSAIHPCVGFSCSRTLARPSRSNSTFTTGFLRDAPLRSLKSRESAKLSESNLGNRAPKRFKLVAALPSLSESVPVALPVDSPIEVLGQYVEVGGVSLIRIGEEITYAEPSLEYLGTLLEQTGYGILDFMQQSDNDKVFQIAVTLFGVFYLTVRPGILAGAIDYYIYAPIQIILDNLKGRYNLKRTDFVIGKRIGEGSFGTVYEGAILKKEKGKVEPEENQFGKRSKRMNEIENIDKLQKVILKKVKVGVKGAEECGEMESWFNLRMRRYAPDICADYLGSFIADATRGQFTEGGQWLVWRYETDSTLADFMKSRDFPDNLESKLFGKSLLKNLDRKSRQSLIVKQLTRQILVSLKRIHSTGIVHRDVKPENLVITDNGSVKFIDFGAATDLRVGKNYVPDMSVFDPGYCPPELYVMPESTPEPPPEPIAALLSPILWQVNHPDLFDTYSAGLVFLQMAIPGLRTPVGLQSFRTSLKAVGGDLKEWRRTSNSNLNLELLDFDGGKGWDLAIKLVCPRNGGLFLKGRLSAAEALRHPYFLLGGDRAATLLNKVGLSR